MLKNVVVSAQARAIIARRNLDGPWNSAQLGQLERQVILRPSNVRVRCAVAVVDDAYLATDPVEATKLLEDQLTHLLGAVGVDSTQPDRRHHVSGDDVALELTLDERD